MALIESLLLRGGQPQEPVEVRPGWLRFYAPQLGGFDLASGGRRLEGRGLLATSDGLGYIADSAQAMTAGEMLPGISSGITVFMYAQKTGGNITSSDFLFGEQESATGQYNYGFYESASSGDLLFFVHNGTTGVASGASAEWRSGRGPQMWVATYGDGDNAIRLYLNGIQVASAAQTGSIQRVPTALLRSCFWAGADPKFALIAAGVAARRLSAAEILGLGTNPWQLLEPERIWVPVSSGPSTPVLSAPTVISITATSATPRVTITI